MAGHWFAISMCSHPVGRNCFWSSLQEFTALRSRTLFNSNCHSSSRAIDVPTLEHIFAKIVVGIVPPVFGSGSCPHLSSICSGAGSCPTPRKANHRRGLQDWLPVQTRRRQWLVGHTTQGTTTDRETHHWQAGARAEGPMASDTVTSHNQHGVKRGERRTLGICIFFNTCARRRNVLCQERALWEICPFFAGT